MDKHTYVNDRVTHQPEQSPVVAEVGYDGYMLNNRERETVNYFMFRDITDTYESWLIRMDFLATWRKAMKGKS